MNDDVNSSVNAEKDGQEYTLTNSEFSVTENRIERDWQAFKSIVHSGTPIQINYAEILEFTTRGMDFQAKCKELMGVAIYEDSKFRYSFLYHTESAKLLGANNEEILEAANNAKNSINWRVYLNSSQADLAYFQNALNRVSQY